MGGQFEGGGRFGEVNILKKVKLSSSNGIGVMIV